MFNHKFLEKLITSSRTLEHDRTILSPLAILQHPEVPMHLNSERGLVKSYTYCTLGNDGDGLTAWTTAGGDHANTPTWLSGRRFCWIVFEHSHHAWWISITIQMFISVTSSTILLGVLVIVFTAIWIWISIQSSKGLPRPISSDVWRGSFFA